MTTLDAFLDSIVSEPSAARSTWLILADWLDDHDAPYPAELIRLHQQMLATCCEPDRHPQRAGWQSRMVELLGQGVRPIVPQHTVTFAEGGEMPFTVDSLEGEDGGCVLVDAEGLPGVSPCVRFGRGVEAGEYKIGQRVEVEGLLRTRVIPGRLIGGERFEAVNEIEVRDSRPGRP